MNIAAENVEFYFTIISQTLNAISSFNEFSSPLGRWFAQLIVDVCSNREPDISWAQKVVDRSIQYPFSFSPTLKEIGLAVQEYNWKQWVLWPWWEIVDRKVVIIVENKELFLEFILILK